MNELQVRVQQSVGEIVWNYEELKAALKAGLEEYKGMIYDDTSIQSAKNDVAMLRKLRKAVEDRRKEIKNKCLEPYAVIEEQAKELTALIDGPIDEIDKQVKDFEEKQRLAKKEKILAFMADTFKDLPQEVSAKLKFKVYDSKWENKTAKDKDWQDAIVTTHQNALGDLQVLAGIEEDFKETATKVYYQNLVLSEALNKVNELRQQREMLLEKERQRKEAEERRKTEEERQRAEEARRAAEMETQKTATTVQTEVVEEVKAEPVKTVPTAEPVATEVKPVERVAPGKTIRIVADEQQYSKILAYIKFVGAEYVEV